MINETLEVQQYLRGENIHQDCLYRVCYLLTKFLKEQGITDKLTIRESIFKWANDNSIRITLSLNNCITNALNDKARLTEDNPIRISSDDVNEIKRRFDTKNMKLLSLAFLCYAKQYADANNEFDISLSALGRWTGITRQHISTRYIPELIDFRYISKVSNGATKSFTWDATAKSKMNTYKIEVPVRNLSGEVLEGNNLIELYERLF